MLYSRVARSEKKKLCGFFKLKVKHVKILVEKHKDGYVAYSLGLKGVVVAEGDTYEEALAECNSAIAFHVESFGPKVLDEQGDLLEAFVAETGVSI